ncbi:hypothetical protein B0H14DRAFT_2559474 [Mycena olivaceomarginata]|nr:hypothetical protein B0H14DRAFT_2559474 [Mycena olivaceomarginata]
MIQEASSVKAASSGFTTAHKDREIGPTFIHAKGSGSDCARPVDTLIVLTGSSKGHLPLREQWMIVMPASCWDDDGAHVTFFNRDKNQEFGRATLLDQCARSVFTLAEMSSCLTDELSQTWSQNNIIILHFNFFTAKYFSQNQFSNRGWNFGEPVYLIKDKKLLEFAAAEGCKIKETLDTSPEGDPQVLHKEYKDKIHGFACTRAKEAVGALEQRKLTLQEDKKKILNSQDNRPGDVVAKEKAKAAAAAEI